MICLYIYKISYSVGKNLNCSKQKLGNQVSNYSSKEEKRQTRVMDKKGCSGETDQGETDEGAGLWGAWTRGRWIRMMDWGQGNWGDELGGDPLE